MKWLVPVTLAATFAGAGPSLAEGDGKKLYESKCAMCHGMDGKAKSMAAGSKNLDDPEWRKTTSSELIVKIVHEGKGKMKGLGERLTAEQAKAIADYVLTLAK
jgi:mono/diheme cytochrome c family protein